MSARGRAAGTARLPESAEFLAEFLTCRAPIAADGGFDFCDVTFEVEFVLLEPTYVELLPAGAALELSAYVLFVVAHNFGDDARGADAFGALCDEEFALSLDRAIDIVALVGAVGYIVVGNVIDVMFFEELSCYNPWAIFYDLIDPTAVAHGLGSFSSR